MAPLLKNSIARLPSVRSRIMGRPRKAKPGEPMILSFKADPDLIAALDAEVQRRNAEKKGARYSRSSVVMQLLWEALDASAKRSAK